jgi:hypothetical protein
MKEDTTPIDPTWMEKTGGYAKDMTMRDELATRAMQAYLSMPELCAAINSGRTTVDSLCDSCFGWADAMLKARDAK